MHSEKPPFLPGNRPPTRVPRAIIRSRTTLHNGTIAADNPAPANRAGLSQRMGPTHGAESLVRRMGRCIGLCSHRSSTTRPLRKGSVTGRGVAAASIADSRPADSEPAHSGCAATGFAGKTPADASFQSRQLQARSLQHGRQFGGDTLGTKR